MKVLCSISTRGRHNTTLPMTLESIVAQTVKPDKVIIFDDNDEFTDIRVIPIYEYLLREFDFYNIKWEVVIGQRKGQHHNHQIANKALGYKWVWRLDDDTVAEPDVLQKLTAKVNSDVGAVGCSILTPPIYDGPEPTGKIEKIYDEPNIQWGVIKKTKEVDHLHCSFLYRTGVVDYNTGLSRVAHREETLFTYGLVKAGYKVLVTPGIVWHHRNKEGGIRDGARELYEHDERIFQNYMNMSTRQVVVLDCGMGDHIVFKKVMKDMLNPVLFTCFPDIIPGRSIKEAKDTFGSIDNYNIYMKMDEWNWKGSLEDAFRKLYDVPKVTI